MSTINIRSAIAEWESLTFKEWVSRTFWTNKTIRAALVNQLQALGLSDKKINGYSVMGLEQTQEGLGKSGVSYTDSFFRVLEETGGCNLIDFLYFILKLSKENGHSDEKTRGIMARGMRTYASLLRDHDFAFNIQQQINSRKLSKTFIVSSGSSEDTKNHTDVLITSKNNKYRIWLFQISRRGLPHDIERLTELRGKLPEGIHILCPLKSEYQMELETIRARVTRLSARIETIKESRKGVRKGTKIEEYLVERLKFSEAELRISKIKEVEINKLLNGNIDSFYGWYLFGEGIVSETLGKIVEIEKGTTKPKPYKEVYEMLDAPRRYLSDLSTFKI